MPAAGTGPSALFAYGTLQLLEIMAALCGPRPLHSTSRTQLSWSAEAARLERYRCGPIRNEAYPGIRPDPAAHTRGSLILGLSEDQWRILDYFEGDTYTRTRVSVRTTRDVQAYAYVLRPEFWHLLEPGGWSLEHFRHRHLTAYRAICRELRRELEL